MHSITYQVEVRLDGSTWTDISADVDSIVISRGRQDDLAREGAGSCAISLLDTTGKYSPLNSSSPYWPYIARPLRQLRVRGVHSSVTYGLFRGLTRRSEAQPDRNSQSAYIKAEDAFLVIERAGNLTISGGGSTTGGAIGSILSAAGWTDVALRSLGVGDTIPSYSASGKRALTLIGELLATELGRVYVNGSGVVVYEDRHARHKGSRATAQSVITGAVATIVPATDLDLIYNQASVTRTGGATQTASDSASVTEYGANAYPAITSPNLSSDDQADSLARWIVSRRKDPQPVLRRVTLTSALPTARVPLLARDLNDRVTVVDALTGASGDYHIEWLEHRISGRLQQHTVTWLLSPREAKAPFLIGRSKIDSTDVLVY